MIRAVRSAAGLLLALLAAACTSLAVPMNEVVPTAEGNRLPRLVDANAAGGDEGLIVLIAFSGGGKRSAAFGHGVLRGLREVPVRTDRGASTLLAEIDMVAGVSGGSFPSSHFGLYGKESFETFPDQFLYRDIEAFIWGTFLLPWNWDWLFNPLVGTNDRMTQVYDRLMYHGATFADLAHRRRPVVSINATDISFGRPFGFLPQSFDVICSDLSKVQVARAVAASNGFPIVFGPVTLRNHRGPECPMPPMPLARDWPRAAEDPRARHLAETLERYNDPERVQWVHLMDGGIADNLALRVMINDLAQMETQQAALDRALLTVRRVLLLSVDGQAAANPDWPRQRTVSGLGQIFSAVSGTQIDSYNLETELLAERSVAAVVERAKQARCATARAIAGHRCDDVAGMVQPIRLADYGDDETRARLQAIRTGLTIPRADVDALVAAGESMVQQHALPMATFLERPAAVAAR